MSQEDKKIIAKNKENIKKSYNLKDEFNIEINRYNDIHFKKKMLLSLAKFSNIFQCENLSMRFEKNKIIIEKKSEK